MTVGPRGLLIRQRMLGTTAAVEAGGALALMGVAAAAVAGLVYSFLAGSVGGDGRRKGHQVFRKVGEISYDSSQDPHRRSRVHRLGYQGYPDPTSP